MQFLNCLNLCQLISIKLIKISFGKNRTQKNVSLWCHGIKFVTSKGWVDLDFSKLKLLIKHFCVSFLGGTLLSRTILELKIYVLNILWLWTSLPVFINVMILGFDYFKIYKSFVREFAGKSGVDISSSYSMIIGMDRRTLPRCFI